MKSNGKFAVRTVEFFLCYAFQFKLIDAKLTKCRHGQVFSLSKIILNPKQNIFPKEALTLLTAKNIQSWTFANKPYENEVTLRGHNPNLKCSQPLKILTPFKIGVDL